jgi:ABC-2 type transport system permease protein
MKDTNMNTTTTLDTVESPDPSVAALRHPTATRSHRDSVSAIPNALASEWTKLRSVRSNRAILGGTTATGIVLVWVLAVFVKTDAQTLEAFTVGNSFSFPAWLSAVMAVVTGTLMFTSEVQHGTLAAAITAQPARWVIVVAKTAIAAAFGLTMGVAGMIAGLSGGVLGGLDAGDTSGMPATAAWGLMFTSVAAVFGLGIGMTVRHSSAAISLTLVWIFVIENLFRGFAPATVSRYLPFNAANGLLNIETTSDPEALAVALTRVQDALLFSGYTVAALTIGTVLLYRRDTN